ncbi:MAG: cupin domain-containing protein [Pseudomonadota bacterium]
MNLNANFDARVVIHSDQIEWKASPIPGVDRRMLDRIGGEIARATTIVRYAPESQFPAHTHTGGEEFIVLDGVFQDEHGDFPAGTYVRNPPTSQHTPGSDQGCVIFVKLWQFDPADRLRVRVNMREGLRAKGRGFSEAILHEDARERVSYREWQAGVEADMTLPRGGEVLVLRGALKSDDDILRRNSWLRLPCGARLQARAGDEGVAFWMKEGHLPYAVAPRI